MAAYRKKLIERIRADRTAIWNLALPFGIRMTPARWFMLASLLILASGMAGLGWWINLQIEHSVVNRVGYNTALYVDSFITPPLQGLTSQDTLPPAVIDELERLLDGTSLGQEVVAFKVWGRGGRVIYSADKSLLGRVFPVAAEQLEAWDGHVAADISTLRNIENVNERLRANELLEIYSPVRASGSGEVIGVVEYYLPVDALRQMISQSQQRSWLIIAGVTLGMYLLLGGFVQRSSATIVRQDTELRQRVTHLTELVRQNDELHERVRRAAVRSAAHNERFLRRVSAELHDGPAQYLGLALLRIDQVAAVCEQQAPETLDDLDVIQTALNHAMQEVRAISAGLGLPQIEALSLADTVARVVRAHERTTSTQVTLALADQLPQVCLASKIATYRLIQEALSNAARHADGVGQQISLQGDGEHLIVSVSDKGPGFSTPPPGEWGQHMGLAGMRERVESLGGDFHIQSYPDRGTQVTARLPCHVEEEVL